MLDKVISENQSAFIKGWLISDNILMARDYALPANKRDGAKCEMPIEVDMSKAFDRVEFEFSQANNGEIKLP